MDEMEKVKKELQNLRIEFEAYKFEQSKYLKIVPSDVCPVCFKMVTILDVVQNSPNDIKIYYKCKNKDCKNFDVIKITSDIVRTIAFTLLGNQP